MTISTQYAPIIFIGDGIQKNWPVNFRIFSPHEVRAGLAGKYGILKSLVYSTDYTVTMNPAGFGGTVHYTVPSGVKLAIWLETAIIQEDDLTPTGPLDAESLELELDRGAIIDQEIFEHLSRTITVPIGSPQTPDELLYEIFSSRDKAVDEANRAEAEADRSRDEADRAHDEADRAEREADAARLSSYARNLRKTLVLSHAVPSGGLLDLPACYYPQRDILYLSIDGMVCSPRKPGGEATGAYQYEEVGSSENETSWQVRVHFPLAAGALVDVWVVASNLMKELAAISAAALISTDKAAIAVAEADRARGEADRSRNEADRAKSEATNAATSAADTADALAVARLGDPDRLLSPAGSRGATIAAGALFAVPPYVVGANQVYAYLEGCLCDPGVHYEEVGAYGSKGTKIKWLVAVPVDYTISILARTISP